MKFSFLQHNFDGKISVILHPFDKMCVFSRNLFAKQRFLNNSLFNSRLKLIIWSIFLFFAFLWWCSIFFCYSLKKFMFSLIFKKKLSFFVTSLTKFFIYSLKKFPFDSWFVDKICIFFHDFLPKFGIFRYFTKTAFFLLTFCDVWSFLCLLTRFALFFFFWSPFAKFNLLYAKDCENRHFIIGHLPKFAIIF